MQALISTQSKSKFYNPNIANNNQVPDIVAGEHDEVRLICSICVKVTHLPPLFCWITSFFFSQAWSSSQCKGLFKNVQVHKGVKLLQLLLDMPVRWGSTYVMVHRADSQKEVVYIPLIFLTWSYEWLNPSLLTPLFMTLVSRKIIYQSEGRLMSSGCQIVNGNMLDTFVLFSVCIFWFYWFLI